MLVHDHAHDCSGGKGQRADRRHRRCGAEQVGHDSEWRSPGLAKSDRRSTNAPAKKGERRPKLSKAAMHVTLLRALVALVPAVALLVGSYFLFSRQKGLSAFLQLVGAAGIVVVLLTHVCEALQLFPAMSWGQEHSIGHYLDLGGAIAGITLFPSGYLLHALMRGGARGAGTS
jgi:hypothetical protein